MINLYHDSENIIVGLKSGKIPKGSVIRVIEEAKKILHSIFRAYLDTGEAVAEGYIPNISEDEALAALTALHEQEIREAKLDQAKRDYAYMADNPKLLDTYFRNEISKYEKS